MQMFKLTAQTFTFNYFLWSYVGAIVGYFFAGLWFAGPAGRLRPDPATQPSSRRHRQHGKHSGRRPPGSPGRVRACPNRTRSEPQTHTHSLPLYKNETKWDEIPAIRAMPSHGSVWVCTGAIWRWSRSMKFLPIILLLSHEQDSTTNH